MPSSKVRVYIPTNPKEKLELAAKILAKHAEMGDSSPLKILKSHSWEQNGALVPSAQADHMQAEDLQRSANEAYRRRDNSMEEIDESIKSSRDLLLSLSRDNPKELGQWGFDVSDSPKSTAKKTV